MTFPFLLIEVDQQSICWMRVFSLQRIPLSQKGGFLRMLGGARAEGHCCPCTGLAPLGQWWAFLFCEGFAPKPHAQRCG